MKKSLKDRFKRLCDDFELKNYMALNESQARLSYIDKFWEMLGWKVRDTSQVQVELTDRHSKRPDYSFFRENKIAFYVEAKKPSENLKNPKHIYQTKLYCWNGQVPLAILTDFEEFRPFRSIGKPHIDQGHKGIINEFDITYEAYPDMADRLYDTFGREAVFGGSLDEIIKPTKIELRDTVDKHFLSDLTNWRKELARHIVANNTLNNEFELAEAVQRILDRLVFMRILQDRGAESANYLKMIHSKKDEPYKQFLSYCREFAPKYNGLIFNPHPLSENLKIGIKLFKKIAKELDEDESPYRFDVIPVEMLGTIYERFLGDEIRFKTKKKIEIEPKPEVRKAGGVYYTPHYIVEYIVQNTVGELLKKCKTPDDAAKLKILDPACGSGSFLLGAFDALIRWHEDYFSRNPGKSVVKIGKNRYTLAYIDNNNITRLSVKMKADILQNNIFGVDIDKQATEVAQMSLYIKALEGLEKESSQLSIVFKDAILPKLDDNIKCGNSLIGPDFISDDFFGMSVWEKHKINPFDWEEQFPFLKETGGFDAVIGNPPYGAEITREMRNYFDKKFIVRNNDTAALFMNLMKNFLKSNGIGSFIVPKPFTYASNWKITRENLVDFITHVVDCGKVWKKVKLEQIIFIMELKESKQYLSLLRKEKSIEIVGKINKDTFLHFEFILNGISDIELKLASKIKSISQGLHEHITNTRGGMLQKYIENENQGIRVLGGKEINRYCPITRIKGFIKKENIIEEKSYISDNSVLFQNIIAHIQNPIDHIKIIGTIIDSTDCVIVDTVNQLEIISRVSKYYILGFINSKLINWYVYRFIFAKAIRTMHFDATVTKRIPIFNIDFSNPEDVARHDKMVELVERMLKLHKDLQAAGDFDKKHIHLYIERTDREIDALVYELYGLTEEEIKIVEGEGYGK